MQSNHLHSDHSDHLDEDDFFGPEDQDELYGGYTPKSVRNRAARRVGKKRPNFKSKVTQEEVIESLLEANDRIEDFIPSYVQNFDEKHFERTWIIESLGGFYRDKLISDVLHIVKKGKEANVYCCKATEATGLDYIAAKLYRPRMFRHLRNDAAYKEGRFVRDEAGKTAKGSRTRRALGNKTGWGQRLAFASWIGHEFRVHRELFEAKADVPKPLAHQDNVILMDFVGEADRAAHTLIDTSLTETEALPLFNQVIGNIHLMLRLNHVHGDLSAYNILYDRGKIQIIDFPQMVDARTNPNAFRFLERDVTQVYKYFAEFGVNANPVQIAAELWQKYVDAEL